MRGFGAPLQEIENTQHDHLIAGGRQFKSARPDQLLKGFYSFEDQIEGLSLNRADQTAINNPANPFRFPPSNALVT
jgi:hypothetical protein